MALRTRLITRAFSNLNGKSKCQVLGNGSSDVIRVDPNGSPVRNWGSSFSTAAAAAADVEASTPPSPSPSGEGLSGSRLFGLVKEYEDYRRALYGGLTHKALLVDAVGTLVIPSQPMAQVRFLSKNFVTHL